MRLHLSMPRAQPVERRPCSVVKGAQHAGGIAKPGSLLPPLVERALRLALKVDDHDVVLGDQHLAKMKVAMDARLEAGGFNLAQRGEPLENSGAGCQKLRHLVAAFL